MVVPGLEVTVATQLCIIRTAVPLSQGVKYGSYRRKRGTIGVFLNMQKGTLSFIQDQDYLGIAFQDQALTVGPLYAAISIQKGTEAVLMVPAGIPRFLLN
jgi:hypothetical protein